MIRLGEYSKLRVARTVDFGLYLEGDQEGDILLPKRYVPEGVRAGDEIEVFVYLDNEERRIATTERPKAVVGDFAYLQVAWVNEYGAFLDWGLMKDLFCPFREQKRHMEQGESYIVHVHIDDDSFRIVASAKVERYLSAEPSGYNRGDEVALLVWQKTDLGFKVIVDNRFAGLVYRDQIFQTIHTGDRLRGFISAVRPDGKIDIALQPTGVRQTKDFASALLKYLDDHGGECPFGDKSDADDIKNEFHVSKKVFKRAVGDLYKQRLISIGDYSIRLI